MQKLTKELGCTVFIVINLALAACTTQQASAPTQGMQAQQIASSQCPNLAGQYSDIPDPAPARDAYPEKFASFRLHWLIGGEMSYPLPEKIVNVIIAKSSDGMRFDFIDASGKTVFTIMYPRNAYSCVGNQLIITKQKGSIGDLLAVNSRNYEMQFTREPDGALLLRLKTMNRGVALFVIPYRIDEEHVYRFKEANSRRPL